MQFKRVQDQLEVLREIHKITYKWEKVRQKQKTHMIIAIRGGLKCLQQEENCNTDLKMFLHYWSHQTEQS